MKPVIALVGRPNVGKSTLFNRLTHSRDALVADFSGLTRDRIYGKVTHDRYDFIVIDTGGLTEQADEISELMKQQADLAIEEADIVFFLVDGRAGLMADDHAIAKKLRNINKQTLLIVNKGEGELKEIMASEFYALGLGEPEVISASQGRGISLLLEELCDRVPEVLMPKAEFKDEDDDDEHQSDNKIRLAVLGRPNVGKSTLINRIMGEDRVVGRLMSLVPHAIVSIFRLKRMILSIF